MLKASQRHVRPEAHGSFRARKMFKLRTDAVIAGFPRTKNNHGAGLRLLRLENAGVFFRDVYPSAVE